MSANLIYDFYSILQAVVGGFNLKHISVLGNYILITSTESRSGPRTITLLKQLPLVSRTYNFKDWCFNTKKHRDDCVCPLNNQNKTTKITTYICVCVCSTGKICVIPFYKLQTTKKATQPAILCPWVSDKQKWNLPVKNKLDTGIFQRVQSSNQKKVKANLFEEIYRHDKEADDA